MSRLVLLMLCLVVSLHLAVGSSKTSTQKRFYAEGERRVYNDENNNNGNDIDNGSGETTPTEQQTTFEDIWTRRIVIGISIRKDEENPTDNKPSPPSITPP
ncbi:uncharacterized protein LOC116345533 [Contarinia nasturtii]|uniref:uncharacterized protein LOC116345533 n=1 Tax=Contarinia nasturtii TaxID=265458 RepID=UPI0012D4AA15|nr:uncharacterized protein LOC116345533 [Contarinia nasturtii]